MSDKSSPGRPPKPDSERAESWLQVRVKRDDKSSWVKQAHREGLTLSQWVIRRLNLHNIVSPEKNRDAPYSLEKQELKK